MNWTEILKDSYEEIGAHFKSELNNASDESWLVKSLCILAQRNIDLFMFGASGGRSNNSYVDVMKTAIRRQIDLNQKTSLPLVKTIDPITNLWNYDLKKSDFDEINKYWKNSFNFPSEFVQKIKNNASDYVHPKLTIKYSNTLKIEDVAQKIYDDCGGKSECLNHFIEKLPDLTPEGRNFLRNRTTELFSADVQSMINFSTLFVQIIKTFNKKFVR